MPLAALLESRAGGIALVVPRSVLIIVVFALLLIILGDLGAQFVVPGHTANPLISGGALTLLGALLTGAKGPKPGDDTPSATAPLPAQNPRGGRHYREDEA